MSVAKVPFQDFLIFLYNSAATSASTPTAVRQEEGSTSRTNMTHNEEQVQDITKSVTQLNSNSTKSLVHKLCTDEEGSTTTSTTATTTTSEDESKMPRTSTQKIKISSTTIHVGKSGISQATPSTRSNEDVGVIIHHKSTSKSKSKTSRITMNKTPHKKDPTSSKADNAEANNRLSNNRSNKKNTSNSKKTIQAIKSPPKSHVESNNKRSTYDGGNNDADQIKYVKASKADEINLISDPMSTKKYHHDTLKYVDVDNITQQGTSASILLFEEEESLHLGEDHEDHEHEHNNRSSDVQSFLSNCENTRNKSNSKASSSLSKKSTYLESLGDYQGTFNGSNKHNNVNNNDIHSSSNSSTQNMANTAANTAKQPLKKGDIKYIDSGTHIDFKCNYGHEMQDRMHLCVNNERHDLSFFKNFSATTSRSKSSLAAYISSSEDIDDNHDEFYCHQHNHHRQYYHLKDRYQYHHHEIYCNYFLSNRLSRSTPIGLDVITETTSVSDALNNTDNTFLQSINNKSDYHQSSHFLHNEDLLEHECPNDDVTIISAINDERLSENNNNVISSSSALTSSSNLVSNNNKSSMSRNEIDDGEFPGEPNIDLESTSHVTATSDGKMKRRSKISLKDTNSLSSPALNQKSDDVYGTTGVTSQRRINTSNAVDTRRSRNARERQQGKNSLTKTTVSVTMDSTSLYLDTVYVNLRQELDTATAARINLFY